MLSQLAVSSSLFPKRVNGEPRQETVAHCCCSLKSTKALVLFFGNCNDLGSQDRFSFQR